MHYEFYHIYGYDLKWVTKEINEAIDDGWSLHGGMTMTPNTGAFTDYPFTYHQMMKKEKN